MFYHYHLIFTSVISAPRRFLRRGSVVKSIVAVLLQFLASSLDLRRSLAGRILQLRLLHLGLLRHAGGALSCIVFVEINILTDF
jgi:hypothetical protein